MWLLIAGFVGLVLGMFLPSLARPFDLVIGLLFTAVGLLGILHNFGLESGRRHGAGAQCD